MFMNQKLAQIDAQTLSNLVVQGLQEKKGEDIVVMDMRKIPQSVVDFFVIATANSDSHIQALMDSVHKYIYEQSGQRPWRIEGLEYKKWVLMDYVDVVVHIFQRATRQYYDLEGLWADAKSTYY